MPRLRFVLLLIALTSCGSGTPPPAPVANLDPVWEGQARRMVDFLAQTHPNPWRRASRDEVLALALRSAAPGLSDGVRRVRLTAALAKLREGHTRPSTWFNPQRLLPLSLQRFSDGLVVTRVLRGRWEGAKAEELLGARLVAVGGQAIGNLQVRLAAYACAENAEGVLAATPGLIVDADVLEDLGVLESDGRVALGFQAGERNFLVHVAPLSGTSSPAASTLSGPLASQRASEDLWTDVLGGEAAYLSYNRCEEGPSFAPVIAAFLKAAQASATKKVIVDLRTNPGGNSWPFTSQVLPALAKLVPSKQLVVLAGPDTFSSAIIALVELRAAGAVFVGSPTSEGANSYGEVKAFRLATAQYEFITSSRYFELLPGALEGDPIVPDVRVEGRSSDFAAGRDPVLEAALGLAPSGS